jgi:anti-sigma-K factor RskA
VTDSTTAPSAANASDPTRRRSRVGPTLMWVGIGLSIASVSVAVGIVALRVALRRGEAPSDETADRIQALIDEANHLIKTLDEKKQT